MTRGLYFYDQYTRVSHLGGIQRYKRHHDELNQALHQHRIAVAADSDQAGTVQPVTPAITIGQTPSPNKQQLQFAKQTNEHLLKSIQRRFQSSFVPDLLFKELDRFFQRYDDDDDESGGISSEATPKVSSSNVKKSKMTGDHDKDNEEKFIVDEVEDDQDLINRAVNRPKLSLPATLILRLHSSWADLIEDTRYRFPVWRTKGGEDEWNRQVERRRIEKANAEKQRAQSVAKQASMPRASSRGSITSVKNLYTRRQTTTTTMTSQLRSNRSVSRVSFATAAAAEPTRLARVTSVVPPTSSESFTDPNKNAVHMEFKFSTQIDPIKQQQQQAINQPKGITVDVRKSIVSTTGDEIIALQHRCKMLLADMKEKIDLLEKDRTPDSLNLKLTKLWFYGDNQQVRNRTNLLTYNEAAKRQRSKFIFSIVRGEIPEKYQIEIEIPHTKKKCLLEFDDGTTQIYYPSGRLAILRLPSKKSEILFFDDKESISPEFLGFVMSDLGTVLMEPSSYPRLISADRFEHFYLCSSRKGEIEKEILWNRNSIGRDSILSNRSEHQSVDDDDILPPLFENTIQFQINRTIQLEFAQPKHIRFGFACDQEEFQFQLIPYKAPTPTNNVSPTNNLMKKLPSKSKQSSQSNSVNEISMKQQIQIERLLDGQINQKELPMFKELLALRKRIRMICSHWLKACRSTLGVMDIESYCLPDLPSARTAPLVSSIEKTSRVTTHQHRSKSAKPPRHVTISPKNAILNREFLQPAEKEFLLRTLSAKKPPSDLLERSLTQFTAHSDTARTIQKNYERRNQRSPVHFPSIGDGRKSARDDLTGNRSSMEMDFPYACPTLIRQRLIKDNRLSIVSDTCSCRVDRLPLIHDLEFDLFITKTNHFNPKQLILVGIINSNLHELDLIDDDDEESDARQSKELCETLEKFHTERNFGRSPMCLCRLLTQDDYRCLIYDLAQATKQSSIPGPLLVRRHHVQPGFLLIYQHGHLIFGDSIFNGYGRNIYDLQKQLQSIKPSQTPLPDEFKFISDHRQANKTILKSVGIFHSNNL